MPNNNPKGINSYTDVRGRESPYGAIERLKVLTGAVPIGSPAAVNAPRRAQRHATGRDRPRRREQSQAPPVAAPAEQPSPYPQLVASFWSQLSSEPGASELVRSIAAEAANG